MLSYRNFFFWWEYKQRITNDEKLFATIEPICIAGGESKSETM